jgi:hypothetical protein
MKYDKMIDTFFNRPHMRQKVRNNLPRLFQYAELICSRARKIGMEVGCVREQILIAMFMNSFGTANVNPFIPITEREVDVILDKEPVSIKTSSRVKRIKLYWSSDQEKIEKFVRKYSPSYDMLYAFINWGKEGALYHIPLWAQLDTMEMMGKKYYIKKPNPGTNSRGVDLHREAIDELLAHEDTRAIDIKWEKDPYIEENYNPYLKWMKEWDDLD